MAVGGVFILALLYRANRPSWRMNLFALARLIFLFLWIFFMDSLVRWKVGILKSYGDWRLFPSLRYWREEKMHIFLWLGIVVTRTQAMVFLA